MIYRFFFSLIYTAVCGILTVVSFAMGQIYESRWKWSLDDEDMDIDEEISDDDLSGQVSSMTDFKINSAFQLGMI